MAWYQNPNARSPENALDREAIQAAINAGDLDPGSFLYPEIGDKPKTVGEILQQRLAVAREPIQSAPPSLPPLSPGERPLRAAQRTQILNRRLADPSTVNQLTELQADALLRRHRTGARILGLLKAVATLAILGAIGYAIFRMLPPEQQTVVRETVSFIPALEPEFTFIRATHADRIPEQAEIVILKSRPTELRKLLATQSDIVASLLQPRVEIITEAECEEFARTLPEPSGQSWLVRVRRRDVDPGPYDFDGYHYERRTDTTWESTHRKFQFILRNLHRDDPLVRIDQIRANIRKTTDNWTSTHGSSPSSQALKSWMIGPLSQHLDGIERKIRARVDQDPLAHWVAFKAQDYPRMDAFIRTHTKRTLPFDPSKTFRAPARDLILLRSPLGSETIYIDLSQPDNPFFTLTQS